MIKIIKRRPVVRISLLQTQRAQSKSSSPSSGLFWSNVDNLSKEAGWWETRKSQIVGKSADNTELIHQRSWKSQFISGQFQQVRGIVFF